MRRGTDRPAYPSPCRSVRLRPLTNQGDQQRTPGGQSPDGGTGHAISGARTTSRLEEEWVPPWGPNGRPACQHGRVDDGPSTRVAVVDDHPAVRIGTLEGLRPHLPGLIEACSVSTVRGLLDLLHSGLTPPDVVLLDVCLADGSSPADNTLALTAAGMRVLLYTQDARPGVVASCLRAGAMGIVGKHEELTALAEAVRTVSRKEPHLNAEWAAALDSDSGWAVPRLAPRELEALRLYATGIAVKSVARRMQISPETVREYLHRVRRKYLQAGRPASTKSDLYVRAVEDGHLPPAPRA